MPPTLSTLHYSARQLLSCPCTVSVPLLQPMAHGTEPQPPLGHNCIRCLSTPTPFSRPILLNLFGFSGQYNAPPHPTFSQFSSIAQSCPTLSNPMNCSTAGLPVHHQLPEFTQTHVHRVGDAIHPSHPLSSTSPPAPNPSQHQSLFQ